MQNETQQIAKQILAQLGGPAFITMTGTNSFIADEPNRQLKMKLRQNQSRAKWLQITLDQNDTYTMHFFRFNADWTVKTIQYIEGVYADKLRDIFTNITGLDTKL